MNILLADAEKLSDEFIRLFTNEELTKQLFQTDKDISKEDAERAVLRLAEALGSSMRGEISRRQCRDVYEEICKQIRGTNSRKGEE